MKYIKIIFGGLFAIFNLIQFLKIVIRYISLPISEWTIGAEIVSFSFFLIGLKVVQSGLKKDKSDFSNSK